MASDVRKTFGVRQRNLCVHFKAAIQKLGSAAPPNDALLDNALTRYTNIVAEAAELKDQCATWTMHDCDARYDIAVHEFEELKRHAHTISGALSDLRETLSKRRAEIAQVTRKDNCARDKTLKQLFHNGLHREFARWLYATGAIRQQASDCLPPRTLFRHIYMLFIHIVMLTM